MTPNVAAATAARMANPDHPHASELEQEERVYRMMGLIAQYGKVEAIRQFMKLYGLQEAMAYRYRKDAEEKLASLLSPEQSASLLGEIINFHLSVLYGEGHKTNVRQRSARDLADLILKRHPARQEIAVSTLDKYSDEELNELRRKVGLLPVQEESHSLAHKPT